MTHTVEELEQELQDTRAERNKYHAELVDLRLSNLETAKTDFENRIRPLEKEQVKKTDFENRIRPLEAGQIKANTIYGLFAGNSLLSIIALVKIFSGT